MITGENYLTVKAAEQLADVSGCQLRPMAHAPEGPASICLYKKSDDLPEDEWDFVTSYATMEEMIAFLDAAAAIAVNGKKEELDALFRAIIAKETAKKISGYILQ